MAGTTAAPGPARYRDCAGVMLFNPAGRIFVGWRKDFAAAYPNGANWQMPQGGIDAGEAPRAAALRELYEETGITSVRVVAESAEWHCYVVPEARRGHLLRGRYVGQRQKWFLAAFEGAEAEIDIDAPGGGTHKAEFSAWRWVGLDELPELVVAFKRPIYQSLVAEFAPLVRAAAPLMRSPSLGG